MNIRIQEHPPRSVYISDNYVGSIEYRISHGFVFTPSCNNTLSMTRDNLQDIIDVLNVENSKL